MSSTLRQTTKDDDQDPICCETRMPRINSLHPKYQALVEDDFQSDATTQDDDDSIWTSERHEAA